MIEEKALEGLEQSFRAGDISPQTLGKHLGQFADAKINQRDLSAAKREIVDHVVQEEPKNEPPKDFLDQLEADGKLGVKKAVFLQDLNRFMSKHNVDLNAADGTNEGMRKNIALQHDKSAVQLGYPVGSYAYWEHIEDGLRRNAPEERSESGTDHTETEARTQPTPRVPIPSVAAPAARTAQAVNNNARQKVVLNKVDLELLNRASSTKYSREDLEKAILAEKQKDLELTQ